MDVFIGSQWQSTEPSVNVAGQWKDLINSYVKVNGVWVNRYEIQEYVVGVQLFNAPGLWAGFNIYAGGAVSPTDHQGFGIRDMNAAEADMFGPLQFQLGIFTDNPLPREVKFVSVGEHEKIPFSSLTDNGSLKRYFYTDGVTNLYEYLKARAGTNVTIKLWLETP